MSRKALAELCGIAKRYPVEGRPIEVLRGLDLSLYAGEFLVITGSSGSGKSTLLHICGCLERATEGSYCLDGRDVSLLGDAQLSALRQGYIGFVFQDFNLLPYATVYENVALPFLYSDQGEKQWRPQVLTALEAVGLSHRLGHRPSALSGGEQQRVAIARAIVCRPKLILADEPTGNLDSVTSQEIIALFSSLHQGGATILLVTHDLSVTSSASRLLTMVDGRLSDLP